MRALAHTFQYGKSSKQYIHKINDKLSKNIGWVYDIWSFPFRLNPRQNLTFSYLFWLIGTEHQWYIFFVSTFLHYQCTDTETIFLGFLIFARFTISNHWMIRSHWVIHNNVSFILNHVQSLHFTQLNKYQPNTGDLHARYIWLIIECQDQLHTSD